MYKDVARVFDGFPWDVSFEVWARVGSRLAVGFLGLGIEAVAVDEGKHRF